MDSEDPKKCVFCGTTQQLKEIWMDEEDNLESCCNSCFNDPEVGDCEVGPVDSSVWNSTNYYWK